MSEPQFSNSQEKAARLADLVNRIQATAQQPHSPAQAKLKIQQGSRIIFEALPGEEPIRNTMTLEQVELLEKALSAPQGIKGSLKITLGGEEIFKVKDGQVLSDPFGLAPNQKAAPTIDALREDYDLLENRLGSLEADSQRFEDDISKIKSNLEEWEDQLYQVENDFSQLGQEVAEVDTRVDRLETNLTDSQSALANLEQQVTELKQGVERQEQQFAQINEQLGQMHQQLERMNQTDLAVANERLGNWLQTLNSQVQAAGQDVRTHFLQRLAKVQDQFRTHSEQLKDLAQRLQQQASQALQRGPTQVGQKASELVERIRTPARQLSQMAQAQLGETAVAVTAAIAQRTASLVGKPGRDHSLIVEGKKQRLEIHSSQITIAQRPPVNPQQLWEQYSQGTNAERPVQRTQETIQKALDDKRSRQEVKAMLSADPQLNAIAQQQGSAKAQQYAQQMIRSALNQRQTPEMNGYQVKKAIDQDRSLE